MFKTFVSLLSGHSSYFRFRVDNSHAAANIDLSVIDFPKSVISLLLRSHPSLVCWIHRCDHRCAQLLDMLHARYAATVRVSATAHQLIP